MLIVPNSEWYFLSHRLALAKALIEAGCDVTVAAPEERNLGDAIRAEGIRFIPLKMDRGYRSFRREIQSIRQLVAVYRRERPDVVHQVTIKPVIYGSIAARWTGIKGVINAIAGLGYTFAGGGLIGAILLLALFDWALIVVSSLIGAHLIQSAIVLPASGSTIVFIGLAVLGILVQAASLRGSRGTIP